MYYSFVGSVTNDYCLYVCTFSATIFWKALRAGVHGKLAQTFAFFLLVLNLQGYRVPLPVQRRPPSPDQETRFQTNHYINISYLAYAPILFQATIVSSTYLFSQVSEYITVIQ
jgi:hypothetical protein